MAKLGSLIFRVRAHFDFGNSGYVLTLENRETNETIMVKITVKFFSRLISKWRSSISILGAHSLLPVHVKKANLQQSQSQRKASKYNFNCASELGSSVSRTSGTWLLVTSRFIWVFIRTGVFIPLHQLLPQWVHMTAEQKGSLRLRHVLCVKC